MHRSTVSLPDLLVSHCQLYCKQAQEIGLVQFFVNSPAVAVGLSSCLPTEQAHRLLPLFVCQARNWNAACLVSKHKDHAFETTLPAVVINQEFVGESHSPVVAHVFS